MATLSRAYQHVIAAVLIATMIIGVVESSWPQRRRRPNRFPFRVGADERGTRSQSGFPRFPSHPHDPAPEPQSSTQVRNAGNWFQNFIASKHASNSPNPAPANPDRSSDQGVDLEKVVVRPPIIKSGSIMTSPAITMIFLETIDVRRRNSSSTPQQPTTDPETPQVEEEVVTNQATTLPSNPRPSRRAFTADEARIRCGGPNEAGQTEECYRFELPNDLNNNAIVIRGAVVLLPAGDGFPASRHHGNEHQRTIHHNVTIVAKFPTSGEGAYRESISVQNISYDIPWKWKSASLPSGSSLVSRALQEDNTLLLKLSIITNGNGQPTTSNFIPMESNMLPVLVVDIEFNGTDSTTSSTTATSTLRSTQPNVVERELRKRRAVPHSSKESLPRDNVTCSGYPGCCRRTMDISVFDLGMDWIIAPERITTSVCLGSCLAPSMTLQTFTLTHMSASVTGNRPSSGNLTCHPSHTANLELLMFTSDGDIQMVELPDFIVLECACGEMKREPTSTTECETNATKGK